MPAFYLEARALEADLLDATPDMPLPPEGFKLLSLTGDLDIVALIASTAMWMHKMVSAPPQLLLCHYFLLSMLVLTDSHPHHSCVICITCMLIYMFDLPTPLDIST